MPKTQLMEEGIDEERGAAKVERILGGTATMMTANGMDYVEPEPLTHATCPECGKQFKRLGSHMRTAHPPKPAAAEPGTLTREQANHLCQLLNKVVEADHAYWEADAARVKAGVEYNAYLESLTKTGQQ